MIAVSNEYKVAAHAPSRQTDIKGQILLPSGGILNFTANDLLQGSTSFSTKCLSNETFEVGGAYIGEFKTTLKSNVDRYALFGGVINVEFLMKVEEGRWETVNIGQFTIHSANRVGKYIEIDAFDNLSLLETELTEGTSGNAMTLFNWACEKCNVPNGMTDEEWAKLVNIDTIFAFNQNDYDTYRDLVSEIATVCGGFVTVDSYGALVIKTFGNEAVDTVDDTMRTESKFEDYMCKYTSISMKVAGELYTASADITDGLTMELPDNNLLAANTPDAIEVILANLLTKLSVFTYVPCEVDMTINPAYELGDMLAWTGYNTGGETINSIITAINWTFRDSMKIESVGENSKIANAKSKTAKSVNNTANQITAKELKTIVYINGEDLDIGPQRTTIVDISFSATKNDNAVPLLSGQFEMDVTDPAVYRLVYELNGKELSFQPEETVHHTGKKIVTFIKSLQNVSADLGNKVRVYLETLPLDLTEKMLVQDETTGTYSLEDVTTTHKGEAKILMFDLEAQLQATNLSFAEKWDGNFEILEEIPQINTRTNTIDMNDFMDITVVEFLKYQLSEEIVAHTNTPSINPGDGLEIIPDYDVIPYTEMTFEKLENNSSDTGTLATDGVISTSPSGTYATAIKGYYMQLQQGESTFITLESESRVALYLLEALATGDYNISKVGENNTIKWTSNGNRFYLIIAGANRQNDGAYTITSTQITNVGSVYIKVNDGYIGEDTTITAKDLTYGEEVTITANEPKEGYFFEGWKTSNTLVSQNKEYTFNAYYDGIYTAAYSQIETAPAPLVHIGGTTRYIDNNVITSQLNTVNENYTVNRIAVLYTKDRTYIDKLTHENIDEENVLVANELTENFPNGMYQFNLPIENPEDDFYLRIEIEYTIDEIQFFSYSNIVETHPNETITEN